MVPLLVTVVVVAVSVFVDYSHACLGTGICGGLNPCGGFQPPPPIACPQPCAPGTLGSRSRIPCPGYNCGQYGCYRRRARARASPTFPASSGNYIYGIRRAQKQFLSSAAKGPDQLFLECCEDRGLPDACLQKCSFSSFTKSALSAMFVKADSCPIEASSEIQFCAAQGRDHSSCCLRNGVATTLAGNKCLVFCDQRPGNVTQLDLSYASCYDRFDSMKSCFFYDLNQRRLRRRF